VEQQDAGASGCRIMGAFDVFFRFHAARRRFVTVTARIATRLFINQVLQREFVFSFYKNTRLHARSDFGSPILAFYLGLYEESSMKFLIKYLRPDDVFVDVGANVGVYTVLAAGVCGARVHAFEPVSLAYRALQDNVSLNGLKDRVTLHKCGVGSQRSAAFITTSRKGSNAISIGNGHGPVEEIEINALDQMLGADVPEMIKVDVEGYEEQVLLGAINLLTSGRVNVVIVEGIARHVGDDVRIERCFATLAGCGFKLCTFDPATEVVFECPAGERPFAGPDDENFLFVRDLARARNRLGTWSNTVDSA
jgi:FkbM family methyltransferase